MICIAHPDKAYLHPGKKANAICKTRKEVRTAPMSLQFWTSPYYTAHLSNTTPCLRANSPFCWPDRRKGSLHSPCFDSLAGYCWSSSGVDPSTASWTVITPSSCSHSCLQDMHVRPPDLCDWIAPSPKSLELRYVRLMLRSKPGIHPNLVTILVLRR